MECGESFAGAAGHRHDLLLLVESESPPQSGESILDAPVGFEDRREIAERIALRPGRVGSQGVLNRFAGEPLSVGMVAAVRLDKRCYLPPERLSYRVGFRAVLAPFSGEPFDVVELAERAQRRVPASEHSRRGRL